MQLTRLAIRAFPAACLLAGCRTETTRPQPDISELYTRKAAQSQAAPSATRLPPGAPRFDSAGGGGAGGRPGSGQGVRGGGEPHYLPPSEQGAYVEMTETPAGSEAPTARDASAPGAGGQGDRDQGGLEGNVPQAVAAEARQGVGGGLPAQGTTGRQAANPLLAQQAGVALAPGAAVTPAQSADSLDQNLAEFRRLMARAQAAAAAERAGSPEGGRGHRGGRQGIMEEGYGAGGAAATATGLGASPDLTGETSGARHASGPSAVLPNPVTDETVVARQLREAAERETDPVLRQKLWLEYRNYTRS